VVVRLLGREVELHMKLGRFDANRLVEYVSRQSGAPDARHERHFLPSGDGLLYRIVIEYEPRTGLRGIYDRYLLRRGVQRAVRQTMANIDATLTSS
jgi:hypothetical protein